jgi:hypothetical protein
MVITMARLNMTPWPKFNSLIASTEARHMKSIRTGTEIGLVLLAVPAF